MENFIFHRLNMNKNKTKKIIIILFLITFVISLFFYISKPLIDNINNDDIFISWPIIDEDIFNISINDYQGNINENKFEKIFESEFPNKYSDDLIINYSYKETIEVIVEYIGDINVSNPEYKYIFEIIDNTDYV